ncbi:hypothetical protein [Aquibacillus rhizosphaerae]|uniref:Uncharacterized protein n=1 Tax=Aquibacillus rhizosphaerae TaxID=3051431 RepID=A0ABT7L8L6_9BACI|nr:hypothetical protein [Aquibacillus sp. LR5S19]MDL4842208.1 hypothetical protein [Aquibacillus sp. LR5S19]
MNRIVEFGKSVFEKNSKIFYQRYIFGQSIVQNINNSIGNINKWSGSMNKYLIQLILILFLVLIPDKTMIGISLDLKGEREDVTSVSEDKLSHNWAKTSSELKMVHDDSHQYDVWHNFIKKSVTCDITHKIKTEIWYCDLHNHTKSEVSLEETIHSHKH